jgi:uncharacterized protein
MPPPLPVHGHLFPAPREARVSTTGVSNLPVFFTRKGWALGKAAPFLPGDIVSWDLPGSLTHIGIVSDRKNSAGVPLILHNIGPAASEADCLNAWPITGHFRVR